MHQGPGLLQLLLQHLFIFLERRYLVIGLTKLDDLLKLRHFHGLILALLSLHGLLIQETDDPVGV